MFFSSFFFDLSLFFHLWVLGNYGGFAEGKRGSKRSVFKTRAFKIRVLISTLGGCLSGGRGRKRMYQCVCCAYVIFPRRFFSSFKI